MTKRMGSQAPISSRKTTSQSIPFTLSVAFAGPSSAYWPDGEDRSRLGRRQQLDRSQARVVEPELSHGIRAPRQRLRCRDRARTGFARAAAFEAGSEIVQQQRRARREEVDHLLAVQLRVLLSTAVVEQQVER